MKVNFHTKFIKNYRRRIFPDKKLDAHAKQRIEQFRIDPGDAVLKDHSLTGAKKGLRSFSVTGNTRILYRPVSEDEVVFLDIGSHNQVY